MKFTKTESNFELEINAEEITSLTGLLKNDNGMELVSSILRYILENEKTKLYHEQNVALLQIRQEQEQKQQPIIEDEEFFEEEPAYKRKGTNDKTIKQNESNDSEDGDLEYFVGVPSNGISKI